MDLIPRHGGVDGGGPGFKAAAQAEGIGESVVAQPGDDLEAALAVVANHHQRLVISV